MEQIESIQNLLNFESKQQKEKDQEDIRVFKYENHFFILKCLAEFYLKGKIIEKKPWKSNAYGTNYMTKAIEYMYDLDFKYGNVKSQL